VGNFEWYPPPICNWTANYTKDSKFVSNVNAALSSLRLDSVEDTSQSRFKISEHGQSPNQVYSILQCRGDATVDQCYNCSQQAKLQFYRIVRITLVVEFGPSSASYVIMERIRFHHNCRHLVSSYLHNYRSGPVLGRYIPRRLQYVSFNNNRYIVPIERHRIWSSGFDGKLHCSI
jgi:hypothetical protein